MDYKKLIVWQKSFKLTEEIYKLTKNYPEEERWGLVSQMRRCSVSIPSNIAEGFGRVSKKHFLNFLKISLGSLLELETQILLSKQINLIEKNSSKKSEELLMETKKILSTLIKKHTVKS